jgi:hypothetical protein
MKRYRSIAILAMALGIVSALMMFYDYKRPYCAEAQCMTVFSQFRTGAGDCFISSFLFGDMGGGSDRAWCNASPASGGSSDYVSNNCTNICFEAYP